MTTRAWNKMPGRTGNHMERDRKKIFATVGREGPSANRDERRKVVRGLLSLTELLMVDDEDNYFGRVQCKLCKCIHIILMPMLRCAVAKHSVLCGDSEGS